MAAEFAFAEAYVQRKLHKEKMKAREEEEEERTKSAGIEAQVRRGKPGNKGGFFGKFKIRKIHPSSAASSNNV